MTRHDDRVTISRIVFALLSMTLKLLSLVSSSVLHVQHGTPSLDKTKRIHARRGIGRVKRV